MSPIIRFSRLLLKRLLSLHSNIPINSFDLPISIGNFLTAMRINLLYTFSTNLRRIFFYRLNPMYDIMMGHVGAAASGLHGGECCTCGLFFDHAVAV